MFLNPEPRLEVNRITLKPVQQVMITLSLMNFQVACGVVFCAFCFGCVVVFFTLFK